MRVQSYADMLLGPGAPHPARRLVSTALPDGRSRAKRAAERQKRPAERDRRHVAPEAEPAEPVVGDASASDPGLALALALASTLKHLALPAVRDAQVSCRAAIAAYADTD